MTVRLDCLRPLALIVLLLACPITLNAQSNRVSVDLTSATCPGSGCVLLSVDGLGAVSVQLAGTFTGTVQFEASVDGATFTALNVLPISGTQTAVTSSTAAGIWGAQVGGLSIVRVRVSAYTNGTVRATIQAAPSGPRG